MKKIISLFLFVLISTIAFPSQVEETQFRENYQHAQKHINEQEYHAALNHFLLLAEVRNNENISYNIGICYLNSNLVYEQEKAQEYLLKASKNTTENYISSCNEEKAPVKVFYYLSIAYFKSYKFEQALETINIYISKISDKRSPEMKIAMGQKDLVLKARSNFNFAESTYYTITKVNKRQHNITENNKIIKNLLFVNEDRKALVVSINDSLFCLNTDSKSTKTLTSDYKANFSYQVCINNLKNDLEIWCFDGKTYNREKIIGDVNTKYIEKDAFITSDGKTIYFSSNRKGGFGGFDIYKCELNSEGKWGKAVNLGPDVNSGGDEITPSLVSDQKTLYYSSNGPKSIGGYDILKSNLIGENDWSASVNLGYPINTTFDDKSLMVTENGLTGYFLSAKQNTSFDIYQVDLDVKDNIVVLKKN